MRVRYSSESLQPTGGQPIGYVGIRTSDEVNLELVMNVLQTALTLFFSFAPAIASDDPSREILAAPQFLSGRQSAAATVHPPERWSVGKNVAWKTDLPGLGWSSPIVWGNRVFVTSCINSGKTTAPRKGLYLEDLDARKYPRTTSEHVWKVYCLDLASGSLLWQQVAHRGVPAKPHHIKNTLASETPATDGERVYALFGNVGLFC